jgi:hypothetical protein
MRITRRMFEEQRERRFGRANPERMDLEFWQWMVRGAEEARTRDEDAQEDPAAPARSPYQARERFGLDNDFSVAVWNFERMGATRTPHPDGRMICVGGEHEDYYDPDFCIYNDVVVLDLDGSIAIYGYPRDVFPPTDFHTATLVGDRILVIGCLGYPEERRHGRTPVTALNLSDYRIEELPSLGEAPGWIFKHEAELSHGVVTIRGGEIVEEKDGRGVIRRNFDDFAYDVDAGTWRRLTDRRWRQFEIVPEGRKRFMRGPRFIPGCALDDEAMAKQWAETQERMDDLFIYVMPEALRPRTIPHDLVWSEEPEYPLVHRLVVAGITVSIEMSRSIEILVEGDMDEALAEALARDVKESVEDDTGRPCLLRRLS